MKFSSYLMILTNQKVFAGLFKMDEKCSLKRGDKQNPSKKEGAYICNTDILKE